VQTQLAHLTSDTVSHEIANDRKWVDKEQGMFRVRDQEREAAALTYQHPTLAQSPVWIRMYDGFGHTIPFSYIARSEPNLPESAKEWIEQRSSLPSAPPYPYVYKEKVHDASRSWSWSIFMDEWEAAHSLLDVFKRLWNMLLLITSVKPRLQAFHVKRIPPRWLDKAWFQQWAWILTCLFGSITFDLAPDKKALTFTWTTLVPSPLVQRRHYVDRALLVSVLSRHLKKAHISDDTNVPLNLMVLETMDVSFLQTWDKWASRVHDFWDMQARLYTTVLRPLTDPWTLLANRHPLFEPYRQAQQALFYASLH
jgi:hypothetical protein